MPETDPILPAPDDAADVDSGRAVGWLAAAIIALPFLQTLEWDFDRCAPLALLPPALWTGRATITRAWARFDYVPRALRWLAGLLAAVVVISTAASPHPAAALVTTASWLVLGLGAVLAGQLVAEEPRHSRRLLAALALSGAIGTVLHWTRWRMGAEPLSAFYPHYRLMGLHMLGSALAATGLLAAADRFRIAWLAIGITAWGGLAWSASRAPLLGLGVGLGVWALRAPRAFRSRIVAAGAAHFAGGLAISLWFMDSDHPVGWSHTWTRTLEASSAQELTSNRSVFWRGAWEHVADSPWIGHGPDAYRFLHPKLEGAQPHNAVLQWLLDFGAVGAAIIAIFVGLAIVRGWRRCDAGTLNASWPVIALASLVAGQLDGFYYHQVGLFSAALALGICGCLPSPHTTHLTILVRPLHRWWLPAAAAAAGVLLLHAWLFFRVARAAPPAPDSPVVRVWQAFPSATLGLERWIEAWTVASPDAALALARAAQRHSSQGDFFHVQTAGLLLRRGDRAGAIEELQRALTIAPWQTRPVITQLQEQVSAAPPTR